MHTRRLLIPLLVSLASVTLVLLMGRAQNVSSDEEQLPPGDWSLSPGGYTGPDKDSLPVIVNSVTSTGPKVEVTKVTLINKTTKFVRQVRLQWQVYDRSLVRKKEDPRIILIQGRTPRITVDLSPVEERPLEYLVTSFAKIYKPLLRDGVLKGKYQMEIMVGQVVYGDGSIWEWGEPTDTTAAL
jgi:hypothetical protein